MSCTPARRKTKRGIATRTQEFDQVRRRLPAAQTHYSDTHQGDRRPGARRYSRGTWQWQRLRPSRHSRRRRPPREGRARQPHRQHRARSRPRPNRSGASDGPVPARRFAVAAGRLPRIFSRAPVPPAERVRARYRRPPPPCHRRRTVAGCRYRDRLIVSVFPPAPPQANALEYPRTWPAQHCG